MEPPLNTTPETNGPPLPVITMPSVTQTTPVQKKPTGGKTRFLVVLFTIIFLLLIVVLYFWGAHLANQA